MSIITVQVGQCGNQVGGELFNTIVEDLCLKPSQTLVSAPANRKYTEQVLERFFVWEPSSTKTEFEIGQQPVKARAVMIDMEQKVIGQTCAEAKKTGKWQYPEKQQFCQKRGSGNNWAHGFCVHGAAAQDKIMNIVQREAEKCDNLGGFLTLLSLAGGTGSGVGAYITQCLRDEFPHSFIVNQVVWPYNMGEVIVQNYNAVLTLSHLYQTADAVVVMENDHIQKICSQLLQIKKISFRDINKVICHKLASVLQPATCEKTTSYKCGNSLGEVLEHLVAHPDYKLLTVKNIPHMSENSVQFSTFQWPGLLKNLRQMLIADAAMEEGINWQVRIGDETPRGSARYNRSVANMLILRGKDIDSADTSMFSDPKLYPSWMPVDSCVAEWKQPRAFGHYEKSVALVTNSKSPICSLNHVVGKAWNMFSSRAYVHQYSKHGMSEDDFLDSFVTLEQVIANYNQL